MNKLIAKLIYPICRELLRLHNETVINSPEYKKTMEESLSKQKELEESILGKSWSYSDPVSSESEDIVTGFREGESRVSAQYPFIDRN